MGYGGESGLHEKRKKKNGMGCSEGESGVSVENTKLLSGGEQMSDCRCACIFRSNTLALGRRVSGHLVAVGGEKKSEIGQLCHIFFSSLAAD